MSEGALVSSGGARYDALVLVEVERLDLAVVERLAALSHAGLPIVIVGQRPVDQPGYRDHAAGAERIRTLVNAMERQPNVRFAATPAEGLEQVRATATPNVRLEGTSTGVNAIEKRIGSLTAFFFRNGATETRTLIARFPRARGRAEVWDPWTGAVEPLAPTGESGAFLLDLEGSGSKVIVFDETAAALPAVARHEAEAPRVIGIGGAAEWRFEAVGRIGSGPETRLERTATALFDWAADSVLRDFSGHGTYSTGFHLDPIDLVGTRIELDLGGVRDVAEITVNGQTGPTLLLGPYRTDVTALLRPGRNDLRVTVTNPPLNRLIGAGVRLGMLFAEAYARPPSRLPAGLLGPVRLLIRPR